MKLRNYAARLNCFFFSTFSRPDLILAMDDTDVPRPPLFRAVASSTRPMCQLLRAISFSNKVHVEISEDIIRFTVDQSRVVQGEPADDGSGEDAPELTMERGGQSWERDVHVV